MKRILTVLSVLVAVAAVLGGVAIAGSLRSGIAGAQTTPRSRYEIIHGQGPWAEPGQDLGIGVYCRRNQTAISGGYSMISQAVPQGDPPFDPNLFTVDETNPRTDQANLSAGSVWDFDYVNNNVDAPAAITYWVVCALGTSSVTNLS